MVLKGLKKKPFRKQKDEFTLLMGGNKGEKDREKDNG